MAPKGQTAASRSAESSNTQESTTQEELAAAQAEIAQLRAQLAAQTTPPSRERSPDRSQFAAVLEALAQRITDGPPEDSGRPKRSAKIPDPPILTDGKDPTFDSWKLQMRGKLRTNADHFPEEEDKMTYVFSRTGGNAQGHLEPRYEEESKDPFLTANDMIKLLASIYEDPHKVQNARLDYRGLIMKSTETFADFHTRFLHLAGQARIPEEDLRPDLFDKLTLELQRTVLPVYSTLTTVKSLADECLSLDQGLRRLKARSDRLKARNASTARNPPVSATTATPIDRKPSATNKRSFTRETTPAHTNNQSGTHPRTGLQRPTYDDPRKQALSARGACFNCGKEGHIARDCPDQVLKVQEIEAEEEAQSGKEEP